MNMFQARVSLWMDECFTPTIKADRLERCDRFIEESLELVQTEPSFTADRAHALVDYVFSRSVGEADQEVGGVLVTLAALCGPFGIDMTAAGEREVARISAPETIEKIRAKQAAKPVGSALPLASRDPEAAKLEEMRKRVAELEALISEPSIERLAEDIAIACVDCRQEILEARHRAMVRLGKRLREPHPRDLAAALGAANTPEQQGDGG